LLFVFLFSQNTQVGSRTVTNGTRSFPTVLHRNLRRSLLLWLMALFVPAHPYSTHAHGQETQSPNALASSLRGMVINSVTRVPVPRALVYSPDNRFAMFTDDQGRFEFELPRPESNTTSPVDKQVFFNRPTQLMARKPGFLEGGSAGPYQPQSAADDLTIALIPESLILGRVNLPS
jgi:hypothetical protein